MVSEVKLVTLGVSDLERACAFYTRSLEYRLVESGTVPTALAPLWRFDPALKGRYAIMAADDSGLGRIRLVQFDAPGQRLWSEAIRYTGSG